VPRDRCRADVCSTPLGTGESAAVRCR
jgi:hypothetical protein